MISEVAVTPTAGEFVEVFNATSDTLDLSTYYLTDYIRTLEDEGYWRIAMEDPGQRLVPFGFEFLVRFPDGTFIAPGEALVVSLHDNEGFEDAWGEVPDFEINIRDGEQVFDGDDVPDMIDPGEELTASGDAYTDSESILSNGGEAVMLFRWDGQCGLVEDVDFMQWGAVTGNVAPNKDGFTIPCGGDVNTFLPDTDAGFQQFVAPGSHAFNFTFTRIDYTEGTEVQSGGNGIVGHDETSENFTSTWVDGGAAGVPPSIGSDGGFAPPVISLAESPAGNQIEVFFTRALDPVTAEMPGNYSIIQIEEAGGMTTDETIMIMDASLSSDSLRVTLTTQTLAPVALHRILTDGIEAAGLGGATVLPRPALFRGFNPGPGLRLEVPKRTFAPSIDGFIEFQYVATQGARILLRVFDMQGRERFVLRDEIVPSGGLERVRWDGRDQLRQRLPAGTYLLHLSRTGSDEELMAPIVIATTSGVSR